MTLFVQRFINNSVYSQLPLSKNDQRWRHDVTEMKTVKEKCKLGENIILVPNELIFGIIDRDHLVDYYPDHINSYWSLPKDYRDYVDMLKSITGIPNVIVLCINLINHTVTNLLRSDEIMISSSATHEVEGLSATDIKNFMMDDPLMDYIQLRPDEVRRALLPSTIEDEADCQPPPTKRQRRTIMSDLAVQFEASAIREEIMLKCPNNFYLGHNDSTITEKLISQGVPIIYKAKVTDVKNNFVACVDLLVRHDYIDKLFISADEGSKKRKKLPRYHHRTKFGHVPYVIVMLTFKKIGLKRDGLHVLKFSNFAYTEGVMALTNQALTSIQRSKCGNGGYLLSTRERTFARVDPPPSIVAKATEALEWRRRVLQGEKFSLLPKPSINHLYPNMKNDTVVDNLKTKYADMIGELTQISFITPHHRNLAIQLYGVDSINHPDVSKIVPRDIGITGRTAQDHVLHFITAQSLPLDHGLSFRGDRRMIPEERIESYIDFETFYNFQQEKTQPYMFGMWTEGGEYKCVVLENLTDESIDKFWKGISDLLKPPMKVVASWGHIENHLLNKVSTCNFSHLKIIDLCSICSSSGLMIPKMKSYRLKDIGKCLHLSNLTNLTWKGETTTAMTAMSHAMRHYLEGKTWNLEAVTKYNEVDCQMLHVIHQLLLRHVIKSD